jgi:hypothetical protein
MPETPLVDIYSAGMGELMGNVVQLGLEVIGGRTLRRLPEPEMDLRIPVGSRTLRVSRVAPLGNAVRLDLTEFRSISGNLPHFHAQLLNELGGVVRSQSYNWHRPWDDLFYLLMHRRP